MMVDALGSLQPVNLAGELPQERDDALHRAHRLARRITSIQRRKHTL
jgi:hypothetical protein